jgi:hypothetical protein
MMTTETITEETNSLVPNLLNEKEPLEVPPISVERALTSCGAASPKNHHEANTDEVDVTSMLQAKSMVVPSMESHYTNKDCLQTLENGGCLFTFACRHELDPQQQEMVNSMINLSAFQDETKENFVPHYEYPSEEEEEYTILLARAAYVLAGVDIQALYTNPSLLSTFAYQQSCQPSGTVIWNDYNKMEPDTFRITKPIIPYIYNFTIQFRVSGIVELERLSRHLGIRVDGGILLERTKRSVPPKEDATVKCKSVLLYTILQPGVVLVTHLTVLLQQGLPEIIERAIDTFGSWGLVETCETAWRTRRYLKMLLPIRTPSGKEQDDDKDVFFDAVDNDEEQDDDSRSLSDNGNFKEAVSAS